MSKGKFVEYCGLVCLLFPCHSKCGPWAKHQHHFRSLSEMQNLGPHPRTTKSQPAFNKR